MCTKCYRFHSLIGSCYVGDWANLFHEVWNNYDKWQHRKIICLFSKTFFCLSWQNGEFQGFRRNNKNQSINQSINWSINQLINQWINHLSNQSVFYSINQSVSRSFNTILLTANYWGTLIIAKYPQKHSYNKQLVACKLTGCSMEICKWHKWNLFLNIHITLMHM